MVAILQYIHELRHIVNKLREIQDLTINDLRIIELIAQAIDDFKDCLNYNETEKFGEHLNIVKSLLTSFRTSLFEKELDRIKHSDYEDKYPLPLIQQKILDYLESHKQVYPQDLVQILEGVNPDPYTLTYAKIRTHLDCLVEIGRVEFFHSTYNFGGVKKLVRLKNGGFSAIE